MPLVDLLIFARNRKKGPPHPLHPYPMITRNILAALSFMLLSTTCVMAQGKLTEEADAAFTKGFYFNAIELYKKAYTLEKKASAKAEIIFRVAESYRALGDVQQAEQWYERANKAQYPDPITYFRIGESLKQQGKYADAIAAFNRYKEKKPGDPEVDAAIAACEQAQKWQDRPTRYTVDPEVMLNTPQMDFSVAFADKKNQSVVFSSTRQASTGNETDMITGENFSDLFTSTRDRLGKWSEPVKLPPSINTPGNEGAPIFNSKRTIMYFTRCPMEKKKVYGCDIWMSKKVGNNYGEPVMLQLKGASKDDTLTVGHPALSPDDGTMVFASNMKLAGHRGGRDLYMVKLDKNGMPTGTPVNLGPEINTSRDELFPFIRFDGSLYFASNGHPGMGALDIYHAESTGEDKWGQVENMKAPLNSSSDDYAIVFDGEDDRGFFSSTRAGGKGQDDIWRFYMPNLVFALQGTVYDKRTNQPLPGAKVSVVGTDGSNFSALSDDNGGFAFVEKGKDERFINENTSYSILVEKERYLVVKDQVTTVGLTESTTFVREYYLQPFEERGIKLPQILYDVDEFFLRPEAKDSLETLYQTLVDNPNIVIELRSHTDARPTRRYKGGNMELSQKRAQSCVNYLVEKGIDAARMVPVGRGAEEPIVPMDVIRKMATKEEQEAAHQTNRRTDFKVIRSDYVPAGTEQAPAPNN